MNAVVNENIKYLANGHIVRVLAQPGPDQIVVELGRTFEDDEDEVFFEGTRVVSKVYDRPPTEAIERQILDLEARKLSLSGAITELAKQEREAKARVEKLKVYDALKRVEDYLAGKITHYVIYDAYYDGSIPRISTPEAERSGDGNRYEDLKLLSLYGSKERTLEWKLNRYSDGSGSSSACIPCCSLEEAEEKAKAILAQSFAKYKVPERNNFQTGVNLIAAAKRLNVQIPAGFEDAVRLCEINNAQSHLSECKKKYDDAVATLQALTKESQS